MKRVLLILRGAIASPETMLLVALFAIYKLFPGTITDIGERIRSSEEILKYLPTIPLALAVFCVNQSNKLRAPLQSGNSILYKWPDYNAYKDRIFLGLTFAFLSAACSLMVWIYQDALTNEFLGISVITYLAISLVTSASFVFAYQRIREILEGSLNT